MIDMHTNVPPIMHTSDKSASELEDQASAIQLTNCHTKSP